MYEDHRVFEQPTDKNASIWRYMSIAKFLALMESSSLHFTRTDSFPDQYEGEISRRAAERIAANPTFYDANTIPRFKEMRERTAVNCWFLNNHESAAMWGLYASATEGVAIRSTVQRLINVCNNSSVTDKVLWLGKVQYIDHEEDDMPLDNVYYPLIFKRLSFSHEAELRAVASSCSLDARGLPQGKWEIVDRSGYQFPIDVGALVEAVLVSSTAPSWFEATVRKVIDRYGLSIPVLRSTLDSKPSW